MAEDIRVWKIVGENEMKEIKKTQFKEKYKEKDLEDWLEKDISLIREDLLVIGRQLKTAYNGEIDLLCLDSKGNVIIVELKRDKTSREVTAQTLDYASWIKTLSYNEIYDIANNYLDNKFENTFKDKFRQNLPEELNVEHQMLIVASDLDEETERIIKYLSEEYGVPINFVKFQFFAGEGDKFLARVFFLDTTEAEQRARTAKKRKSWSIDEIYQMLTPPLQDDLKNLVTELGIEPKNPSGSGFHLIKESKDIMVYTYPQNKIEFSFKNAIKKDIEDLIKELSITSLSVKDKTTIQSYTDIPNPAIDYDAGTRPLKDIIKLCKKWLDIT